MPKCTLDIEILLWCSEPPSGDYHPPS
jgi:hypothetical protein